MRVLPRTNDSLPTTAEMRLLQVLWNIEEGSVEDIVNAHPPRKRPNYKTTQTLLRIMEKKGYISHVVKGRVFIFEPLISRKTVDRSFVQALLSRNFGASAKALFVNLLESASLEPDDIDELEGYLNEYRKKGRLNDQKPKS